MAEPIYEAPAKSYRNDYKAWQCHFGGTGFVIPPEKRFRVRIVASLAVRAVNVAQTFDVYEKEAKSRIIKTKVERLAFIRKYYHADTTDHPMNHDMVLRTAPISIENTAGAIAAAIDQ